MTFPRASIRGPPELPLLIAASVWIAPEIELLSGEVIVRPVALTIPDVMLLGSPNGLPIATTFSPT
jgi:hypothetical protein